MCLQAEFPLRMRKTIVDHAPRVRFPFGAVEWLQKKMLELEVRESLRLRLWFFLRIDQFEFITCTLHDLSVPFWTDAKPVDTVGRRQSAIAL